MHASPARFTRQGLAAAVLLLAVPVWAQTTTPQGYQQERAACAAMSNPESRSNCLRDLGAARQQARNSPRPRVSADELQRNALRRCEVHKDADERAICERMARGEGQVSGSVAGGGQIRSLETTVPGPAMPPSTPPAMPPTSSPPAPMAPSGAMPPMSPSSTMPMQPPGAPPSVEPMRPPTAPPSTVPPMAPPPATLPPPRY